MLAQRITSSSYLRRACWLVVGASGCAATVSACTGDLELGHEPPSPCDFVMSHDEANGLELLTFWSEDEQERRALAVLRGRAEAVDLHVTEASDEDRVTLQKNLQEGNFGVLPDVFQVNGGSDVLQYIHDAQATRICDLEQLAEQYDVRDNYFAAALAPSTCRGTLYAWPLSIHRLNTILVNLEVYSQVEEAAKLQGKEFPRLDKLKNADALLAALEVVKSLNLQTEDGKRIVPLSLGLEFIDPIISEQSFGQEWVLLVIAFENFLLSYDLPAYKRLWYGMGETTEDELRARLQDIIVDLRRIRALIRPGARSWQEATLEVGEGSALLAIGGDWMRAQLDEATLDSGRVVSVPFPGTDDFFVYTPDSFAVPRQVKSDGSSARNWLTQVVDDLPTQLNFSRRKQAIPAASGLGATELIALGSDYLTQSYHEFSACHQRNSSCQLLLAISGLGPSPNLDPCFDRLGQVLAKVAGVKLERTVPQDPKAGICTRPMPESVEQAEAEMIEVLLAQAREPFRKECREP